MKDRIFSKHLPQFGKRVKDAKAAPFEHITAEHINNMFAALKLLQYYGWSNLYKDVEDATRYEMAAALRDVLYLVRSGKIYMNLRPPVVATP